MYYDIGVIYILLYSRGGSLTPAGTIKGMTKGKYVFQTISHVP